MKVSIATIAAFLEEGLDAPNAIVGNEAGEARMSIAASKRKVEAVYSHPYRNDAPMEVMNATVL